MRITLRNLALLGVAYVAGYVKGQQDGDKLAAALTDVGEGLKVMAKEIGIEVAMREKNADAIDVEEIVIEEEVTEEQIHEIRLLAQGGMRTDKDIADRMGLTEATVRKVLADGAMEERVISLASSSDGFAKTNEEIAQELDISEDEVVRILLNANPPGEHPDQPGSDAT